MIQYFIPLPLKMNKQVENTSNSKVVQRKYFINLLELMEGFNKKNTFCLWNFP